MIDLRHVLDLFKYNGRTRNSVSQQVRRDLSAWAYGQLSLGTCSNIFTNYRNVGSENKFVESICYTALSSSGAYANLIFIECAKNFFVFKINTFYR